MSCRTQAESTETRSPDSSSGGRRCRSSPRQRWLSVSPTAWPRAASICPREVEEALLLHPDVQAVAVVGRPDPEWGESVVAFVVAIEGRSVPQTSDLDQLCLERIARYKRPKEYRFVGTLPMNNYGKVVKRELRGQFQAEDERPAPGG